MTDRDELRSNILTFVAKRGYIGAGRDDFFGEIKGVSYKELEEEVRDLEKEGYLTIAWIGDNNFIANITEKGQESIG